LVRSDVSAYEPLIGRDETTIYDITTQYLRQEKEDETVKKVKEWIKRVNRSDVKADAELAGGIELADEVSFKYNLFYNLSQAELAGQAIWVGKVLLTLKELTKKANQGWPIWAQRNLAFIKERNRQRFMLLAGRPDCYRYRALGVERLEMLVAATRGIKGDPDPIGTLLKHYNIEWAEDSQESLSEFKGLIDAALANERLRKNEIKVDFNVVQQLTQYKVEINQTLITNLKEVEASGGSEQKYLENLAINAGKKTQKPTTEKKMDDFNSLSVKMTETLEAMTDDEDQLEKVDKKELVRLFLKLQTLKNMLVPDEEVKTA